MKYTVRVDAAAKRQAGGRRHGRTAPLRVEGIMDDLRRVFRTVGVLSRRAEAVTGLSAPQLWALRSLVAAGPSTPGSLSRRMRLHPDTVAGFLEFLEARGLAAALPRAGGRLAAKVAATERGAYLGTRAPQVPQIILLEGLGRLSAERLRTISAVMRQLVRILEARDAPAQLLLSSEINRSRPRRADRQSGRRGDAARATTPPSACG